MAIVDREGFAAWVGPHLGTMAVLAARLAGRDDRDDVVQEALTRAWQKREQYDERRGSPRAWLLAIVADRACRTRGRRRRRPIDLVAVPPDAPVFDRDSTDLDLERAIAALPRRMRMAINCVYFAGLSVAETAVLMGVAPGTVKSTLSDARAKLRTTLEEAR